ncbi:MAG: N(4)-(beta-N-acetylglucosaminyl)-L-asparaginase [Bacteroidetes bacterium]|nr:N(4)-(beta-N-acetylglucosaminyl)-L-asparaginase [Bacteroidota bacterium]
MSRVTRRMFLSTTVAGGIAAAATPLSSAVQKKGIAARDAVVISSGNGIAATERAMAMIRQGSDALDAVIAGVNIVEDDPNDMTVGLGGLPNELGIVELDASVMHGPTHRAGSVASLRNIKNPSSVAKVVMERTDHVLLVGEGALNFARMHGFKEENLLTEESRKMWLKWKENLSTEDDYLPPHGIDDRDIGSRLHEVMQTYGTINCLGKDLNGNISGVTTTSGLSYKIPGRVGDSPIIGAGLYVDNEVGAAGSTGRGEANLTNCSSVMIVEFMRQGKSPEEACLMACQRIIDHTRMKRLLNKDGKPDFNVSFYAINKKGEHGSASLWQGGSYCLHDGVTNKKYETAYLLKGPR